MTVHSEDQLKTSMTQSWESAMAARDALVEEVAGFDDELAEKVMVVNTTSSPLGNTYCTASSSGDRDGEPGG